MSTAKKEPGLASLVIVLALICLVVAALLGLVNQVTAPAIAANTEKTIQDSWQWFSPLTVANIQKWTAPWLRLLWTPAPWFPSWPSIRPARKATWWRPAPNGFGGALDMMAGINSAGEVTGLAIITHSARPPAWAPTPPIPSGEAQFAGATDVVSVTKDGGTINAITGATITSRVRSLRRRQRRPCCCGSTGLRRDRKHECKETIY